MNLKVLKLRSGEEIAGQILEETESVIKIFQPMVFRTLQSYDEEGRPCDVTTLHDWLVNMEDKNVSLPLNHIAFMSEPSKDTKKLYEIECEREFSGNNVKTVLKDAEIKEPTKMFPEMQMDKKEAELFSNFLEELMDTLGPSQKEELKKPLPKKRKKLNKNNYLPPDMKDESELDRHMIMMQLYIPAEAIMNMITSGLLDPKVLLDMVNEVKKRNRFTGDEKNRGDFGNKLSDWNPDPNSGDYN